MAARRLSVVRLIPVLDFGGVESRFLLWAKLIDRSRYEPRVCTLSKAGRAASAIEALGVPVDCLDRPPSVRSSAATSALYRYLREVRPDVLHSSVAEANFHGILAGRAAGVPRILAEETGIPNRSAIGRLAFGACYRAADAVVAVSEATRAYLEQQEMLPSEWIRQIPNCAAPHFFGEAKPRSPSEGLRVLAVGRLDPVKNFDGLLRAFRLVLRELPEARLTIAGDGPSRGVLEALAARLELVGAVDFLGYSPDVARLHAAADLFVLPSHSEGQSVALIEAMASGLPFLASNKGGNPELARGLEDALIEPGDHAAWAAAILRFARSSDEARAALAARVRAIARERFSPERYLRSLDALYREPSKRWASRSSR